MSKPSVKKGVVWVVDDDRKFARKFRELIQKIDFVDEVILFETAEAAADRIRDLAVGEFPIAVFVDVYLEGDRIDGMAFIDALQNQGHRIPCILISHSDRAKIVRAAAATPARFFLVKHSPEEPNWLSWQNQIEASLNFALSKSASLEEMDAKQTTARLKLFYQSINHDYRQPIVRMSADLREIRRLTDGLPTRERRKFEKMIESLESSIAVSLEVVEEIECLVADGRVGVSPKSLHLGPMLRQLKHMFRREFEAFDIEVAVEAEKVELDRGKIARALHNIVQNSAKFTVDKAKMKIAVKICQQNPSFVEIEILDWGIGIPERDLDRVWLPGTRAENVDGYPGHGRGLALVRLFVEAHVDDETGKPGSCHFEIPNETSSTKLVIRLPRRAKELLIEPLSNVRKPSHWLGKASQQLP